MATPKEKNPEGRPPTWKNPEDMQVLIDAYFTACEQDRKPITMSGLALALDVDRKTIVNYAHKDKFLPTIKRARARCENYIEDGMISNKINPTAGIFNLKNNYGWEDKMIKQLQGDEENPLNFTGTTQDATKALSILEDEIDQEPETCESSETTTEC